LILRGVLAADEPLSSGGSSFARPVLGGGWRPVLRHILIGEMRRDFSCAFKKCPVIKITMLFAKRTKLMFAEKGAIKFACEV
jgi:hypothetical protein